MSASPLEISVCGGTAVDHRQIVKETPKERLSGVKEEEEVQEQILAPNLFVFGDICPLALLLQCCGELSGTPRLLWSA